jgi:hypothetical protein
MIHTSAVLLADSPGVGCIVACQCGYFHLHLGAMSLNFSSASEFIAVADLLRNAAEQLPRYAAEQSQAPTSHLLQRMQ